MTPGPDGPGVSLSRGDGHESPACAAPPALDLRGVRFGRSVAHHDHPGDAVRRSRTPGESGLAGSGRTRRISDTGYGRYSGCHSRTCDSGTGDNSGGEHTDVPGDYRCQPYGHRTACDDQPGTRGHPVRRDVPTGRTAFSEPSPGVADGDPFHCPGTDHHPRAVGNADQDGIPEACVHHPSAALAVPPVAAPDDLIRSVPRDICLIRGSIVRPHQTKERTHSCAHGRERDRRMWSSGTQR